MRNFATLYSLSVLAACSGGTSSVLLAHDGSVAHSGDAGGSVSDGASTDPDGGSDGSGGRSDASGPVVYVRLLAVQTPIAGGGVSQETPVDQHVGIYGLSLLKDASDPSPLVVFSETAPVDTPYNANDKTLLGVAPASGLAAGTYTIARVPVGYVKFTVAGTYHYDGTAVAGDFTDLIALSSGVVLDGATHDRGWWSSSFSVAGQTEGSTSGENAEIAQPGADSHISLDLSGAEATYVFPVDLTIPPSIESDQEILFTVNTYEDFHWMDETEPGYQTGVFDVAPGTFEPVTQLGANSFTITIGPAP